MNGTYLACDSQITMVDVILFNELSQVLFMYDYFKKFSTTAYAQKLREENEEDHDDFTQESSKNLAKLLMHKDTNKIYDWYSKTMQKTNFNDFKIISKFDDNY